MLKRQFSQFKNQQVTPKLTQSHFEEEILLSPSSVPSPFFQPIQTTTNHIPLTPTDTRKIGFVQSSNQSKKNSIISNLSGGNNLSIQGGSNLSSQGFKMTQTTYYTDKNEVVTPQNDKLQAKFSSNNTYSNRRIKTDRVSSLRNIKNNKAGLKFQEIEVADNSLTKHRNSQQPSLAQLMTSQQKIKGSSTFFNSNKKFPSKKSTLQMQNQQSQMQIQTSSADFINESQVSISQQIPNTHFKLTLNQLLSKQNSVTSSGISLSKVQPLTFQKIVSEASSKKTPFSNVCKQINTNMQHLQKKIKSKVQFFNHFSKILSNKSHYLQGIFLIPEIQEVLQDPVQIDKALVQVINGVEFRASSHAQRGMIKNLILELNILNKEIFDVYLLQSKQEINHILERIQYEREEVDYLTSRLKAKHYPNFEKKATLINVFSHHNMPVTYNKEKYSMMEEKFGKFKFISHENRFVCSEIEKVICDLKEVNYTNNNPYRNTIW